MHNWKTVLFVGALLATIWVLAGGATDMGTSLFLALLFGATVYVLVRTPTGEYKKRTK